MFADVDARAAELLARTEALLESLNLPDQVRWDPLVTGGLVDESESPQR